MQGIIASCFLELNSNGTPKGLSQRPALLIHLIHGVLRHFYCNTDMSSYLRLFLIASKYNSYNIDLGAHEIQSTCSRALAGKTLPSPTLVLHNYKQTNKQTRPTRCFSTGKGHSFCKTNSVSYHHIKRDYMASFYNNGLFLLLSTMSIMSFPYQ